MDCLFCKIAKKEIDSFQLYEDDFIMAFLDINPVSDGHTLIIPKKHYDDYTKVPDVLMSHIMKKAEILGDVLTKKLDSKGYHLGINYGDKQEIKHFHLHLIPTDNSNIRKPKTVFNEITKNLNITKSED